MNSALVDLVRLIAKVVIDEMTAELREGLKSINHPAEEKIIHQLGLIKLNKEANHE
jgi:hypothetical protein